jgi:DNA polymerase (family 10)
MLKNKPQVTNEDIAGILDEIAALLEFQEANAFRIRAFRNGAREIRNLSRPVDKIIAEEGLDALKNIPGIGEGLMSVIGEYLQTGRSSLLDRLQGEVSSADLISRIGGIGNELAERVVRELDIHTLEELEEAAYDGRLAKIKGFGPQRVKMVRDSLAGILSRAAQRRIRERLSSRQIDLTQDPPVELLLEIDTEYRRKAKAGQLRKVAPKRFNPEGEAWLPVMHTERDRWSFTALFSNTALAHELGATRDWVVIYYEKSGIEKQATVMTAKSGPLKGKRIVRGREDE